jgi:hypothetical protein
MIHDSYIPNMKKKEKFAKYSKVYMDLSKLQKF